MLNTIIVIFKHFPCIKWRVNVDAFNLTSKLLFQRPKGKEVIAKNQPIVEEVVLASPVGGMIRLGRVLDQNTRLQLRPILLADPGQFKADITFSHYATSSVPLVLVGTEEESL